MKCLQNSGHPAVLTCGETGEIKVEFDKNISEIPARFQWTSDIISKKQFITKFHQKIRTNFQAESKWNSDVIPVDSTGTPPEYHWNPAGLTSEETVKIPADFQQKIHRKSTGVSLKFHRKIRTNFPAESKRNSGGIPPEYQWYYGGFPDILADLPAGRPAGFRRKFRWHSGAFFSWATYFTWQKILRCC